MENPKQTFVGAMAARYGRRLRTFLSARLRNAADAPDLAQEVFLRLLRVERHDTIRSPEAYLFTVASHVLHQHALRESLRPAAIDLSDALKELHLAAGDDPTETVDRQQRLDALACTLAQLPPKHAVTLLLHRYAGHSIEEIAHQLGVSRGTAKNYLARALLYCRDQRKESEPL